MIYLITFFSSYLFLVLSEIKLKNCSKYVKQLLIVIGIAIPVILAAARSMNVGTDVKVYGYSVFNTAVKSTRFSDMNYLRGWYQIELGYRAINFIISRFTDNLFWILGAIQLFINILVYQALKYFKNHVCTEFRISWGMLIFYLLFYNETLNLMRQSMALAIVLFTFRYIYQNKPVRYFIGVVLAMQFHVTAIVALLFYPLYYLIVIKDKKKLLYGIVTGCLVSGTVLPRIIVVVIQSGLLGEKFNRYLSLGEGAFSLTQMIIRIPFVILLFYFSRKRRLEGQNTNYWMAVLLLDFAFAELRSSLTPLYRISLYFSWFKMQAYYDIVRGSRRCNQKYIQWGMITFFLVLWWYQNVYMGNNGTYPYSFA